MRYYEITNMDDPKVNDLRQTRVIDDDEFDRRLLRILFEEHINLNQAKEILLHGKFTELPDPWEELTHELADALGFLPGQHTTLRLEAALNKLKALVERKD